MAAAANFLLYLLKVEFTTVFGVMNIALLILVFGGVYIYAWTGKSKTNRASSDYQRNVLDRITPWKTWVMLVITFILSITAIGLILKVKSTASTKPISTSEKAADSPVFKPSAK